MKRTNTMKAKPMPDPADGASDLDPALRFAEAMERTDLVRHLERGYVRALGLLPQGRVQRVPVPGTNHGRVAFDVHVPRYDEAVVQVVAHEGSNDRLDVVVDSGLTVSRALSIQQLGLGRAPETRDQDELLAYVVSMTALAFDLLRAGVSPERTMARCDLARRRRTLDAVAVHADLAGGGRIQHMAFAPTLDGRGGARAMHWGSMASDGSNRLTPERSEAWWPWPGTVLTASPMTACVFMMPLGVRRADAASAVETLRAVAHLDDLAAGGSQ